MPLDRGGAVRGEVGSGMFEASFGIVDSE